MMSEFTQIFIDLSGLKVGWGETCLIQEKVHEELDCVLGDKSEVTEEDLKELVYLEQVSAAN